MWDDVIIGKGPKGRSAIRVFSIKGDHSISQDSVSYWIGHLYLGAGMTIFKDTEEGRQLTKLVGENAHIDQVKPWLDSLVLQYIDKERLKGLIDNALARSFEAGSNNRAYVICQALGLTGGISSSGI